jgi:hypothetical protein
LWMGRLGVSCCGGMIHPGPFILGILLRRRVGRSRPVVDKVLHLRGTLCQGRRWSLMHRAWSLLHRREMALHRVRLRVMGRFRPRPRVVTVRMTLFLFVTPHVLNAPLLLGPTLVFHASLVIKPSSFR